MSTETDRIRNRPPRYKIPDGWLNMPPMSLTMITDIFVAFKTPLDQKYKFRVPANKRFDTEMLFSTMSNVKVKIGLWIDLTNTDRYYDKSEVKDKGCCYVKIPCTGGCKPPTPRQIQLFLNICSKFVTENPLQSIGVHCSHGFNRTGFLIVAYLIEILNFDVTSAIAQFAAARPPGIYRPNLIAELYRRYQNKSPSDMALTNFAAVR